MTAIGKKTLTTFLKDEMRVTWIARVCHEALKAYCESLADYTQVPWDDAPQWQKYSAICGVRFCLANPDAPASHNHDDWMRKKLEDGWVYGPVKDEAKKEHPCLVPHDQLSPEQRKKDELFKAIVAALA
jgi:hypothetical protein